MRSLVLVPALLSLSASGWCHAATVEYEFVAFRSEVDLQCGFLVCDETYALEGAFALDVNFALQTAEFINIDAQLVGPGLANGRPLDTILGGLHGSVVDERTVGFSGSEEPGPVAFHLRLGNSRLKLSGGIDHSIVDGESISIDALALAVGPAGIWVEGPSHVTAIDALTEAVNSHRHPLEFDLNNDGRVDRLDRTVWVEDVAQTYFGDSNLDGLFNSGDLISVFQAGQYEDQVTGNSTWATGDWNGDGEFGTSDMVIAFQDNGYDQGFRQTAFVPEPMSAHGLFAGLLALAGVARRQGRRFLVRM